MLSSLKKLLYPPVNSTNQTDSSNNNSTTDSEKLKPVSKEKFEQMRNPLISRDHLNRSN